MKTEFETRIYRDGKLSSRFPEKGYFSTIEGADKFRKSAHTSQVTFEDIEFGNGNYTHILGYRDGEHFQDLYFREPVHAPKNKRERNEEDPEEKHWKAVATYNERNAPCNDPDFDDPDY